MLNLELLEKSIQVGTLNSNNSSVTVTRQFPGFNVTADRLNCEFKMSCNFLNSQPFVCSHRTIIPLNKCISNHLYKITLDKH